MSIAAGTRLGVYEIVAPIGAGGMGEVYRARDTRLDRSVAIKVLPAEFASNPQLRLRFDREAKTISQLNHPNICALYDVGQDNGTPYLVMELLDGQTLASRISRGPLPLSDVLTYGVQIAEALERAHRAGVVHRDLKPGNIMLTRSGAKLLDFGLAKAASVLASPDGETQQKSLTAEGTIVGTFQYMAPEQLEGIEADARTDIFALGSVLYEMATGRPAFEGKTRTSLIAAIVSSNPAPVSQLQPLTPATLEHVIAKCLEKEPDARWQNAHDIAEQLRWIRDRGVEERTVRGKQPAVREWIAWTLAAVSIAAVAALAWRQSATRANQGVLFAGINPPPGQTFAFDSGRIGSLTMSPDGKYVTFATVGPDGDHHLWIRALDSDSAVLVPASASEEYFPFWSPDSRSLAYFSDGKLKRTDTHGSTPVIIADAPTGRSGSWSKDGVILFSPISTGTVHRVSAAGGKSVPVTTIDVTRRESTHRWATFLPDGKHFLYLAASHAGAHTDNASAVFIGSTDDPSLRKQILSIGANVAFADGNLLYVRDRSLVAQRFDTSALELRGDPAIVVRAVSYDPGYWRALFAVSDSGSLIYVPGEADPKSTLQWIDRQGGSLGTSGQPAPYAFVSLSPDDATAAVVLPSPAGTTDIWLHDFSRGINQRFTFGEGDEGWPLWSPDGNRIAFSDSRDATDGLYVKDIGATTDRLVYYSAGFDTEGADWSPDGKYIAATRHKAGQTGATDIIIVPMDGSGPPAPFLPGTFNQDAGVFSPDGKWLAYTSKEAGRGEVFVARFPAGISKQQVSTEGVRFIAAWRGDQLFYGTNDGKMISVTLTESANRMSIGTPRVMPFDMPDAMSFAHRSDRIFEAVQPKVRPEIALIANWESLLPR